LKRAVFKKPFELWIGDSAGFGFLAGRFSTRQKAKEFFKYANIGAPKKYASMIVVNKRVVV